MSSRFAPVTDEQIFLLYEAAAVPTSTKHKESQIFLFKSVCSYNKLFFLKLFIINKITKSLRPCLH